MTVCGICGSSDTRCVSLLENGEEILVCDNCDADYDLSHNRELLVEKAHKHFWLVTIKCYYSNNQYFAENNTYVYTGDMLLSKDFLNDLISEKQDDKIGDDYPNNVFVSNVFYLGSGTLKKFGW